MALEEIIGILNQKIGLNPSSIGTSSIERAVNHRISCRNCVNVREYAKLLAYDSDEVRELIEEVVVPETWFFRNKGSFEALRKYVRLELLPKSGKRKPIRILSVPCATGEEPYSIAMALMEESVDPQFFRIDAMDVSKKAIELAKDAHFGKNSFRDFNIELREKYFDATERGWLLKEGVRSLVKFTQGNILHEPLSPQPAYYDVVFCRNLLIYFDRKTQQFALEKIRGILKKGAIMFVGHAECSQVSDMYYQRSGYPKSFSFLMRDKPLEVPLGVALPPAANGMAVHAARPAVKRAQMNTAGVLRGEKPAERRASKTKTKKIQNNTPKAVIDSLRPVEKLANQGRYQEAQTLCNDYLLAHPQSAHGHYLLGMINNLLGEHKSAESLLKKAIYLDPNHEQALVLSALLAEQKGDLQAAQSFRRRVERVQNRNRQQDF